MSKSVVLFLLCYPQSATKNSGLNQKHRGHSRVQLRPKGHLLLSSASANLHQTDADCHYVVDSFINHSHGRLIRKVFTEVKFFLFPCRTSFIKKFYILIELQDKFPNRNVSHKKFRQKAEINVNFIGNGRFYEFLFDVNNGAVFSKGSHGKRIIGHDNRFRIQFLCIGHVSYIANFWKNSKKKIISDKILPSIIFMFVFQLPKLGPKFLFVTGIFVAGVCNLLFG